MPVIPSGHLHPSPVHLSRGSVINGAWGIADAEGHKVAMKDNGESKIDKSGEKRGSRLHLRGMKVDDVRR